MNTKGSTSSSLAAPWSFLSVLRLRDLLVQLVRRDIVARYRGSLLGLFWALATPLAMLAAYTFVFSVVFRARWGVGGQEGRAAFALMLFSGLVVYQAFADCLVRAPGVILAQANYVKKIVFPLELLPLVPVLSAFFQFLASFVVLLAFQMLIAGAVPWTVVFTPLVLLPHLLLCAGLCWFLASLGTYLRDIGLLIGIFVQLFLFLSPIFYPLEAVPAAFRPFLQANPLTGVIGQFRRVLFDGLPPAWGQLLVLLLLGWIAAWLGFIWFQRTRKGFADVV